MILHMKLYLIQHAKAAAKEVDPQRSLSKEGLQELKKIASFIKPLDLTVDHLWHSEKTRAAQTADALAEVIHISKEQSAQKSLGPNDDVAAIRNKIIAGGEDIMIVGHLPFLSRLASLLLTGDESASTIAFRNAGIISLNCPQEQQWQIDWIITPELLAE